MRCNFFGKATMATMVASLVACSVASAHVGFDGSAGGTWEDPNNWTDGASSVLPFLGANNDVSRTHIGSAVGVDGNPAGTISPATVSLSSSQTIGTLHIANGGSGGTLNHSAGKLSTGWLFAGNGGATANYNMSGTASFESPADTTGGNVQIFGGGDGTPNGRGNLRVQDTALYNGWETWIGTSNNAGNRAMGFVTQTGGTVKTEIDLVIGREHADGTYGMTNGLLQSGRVQLNDNGTPGDPSDDFTDHIGGLFVGRYDGSVGSLRIQGGLGTIQTTNLSIASDFAGNTSSSGTLAVLPNASGITAINASGNVFLGDGSLLTVSGLTLPAMNLPLINVGGTLNGTFSNGVEGQLYAGSHRLTYLGGDGNDVVLRLIPEPSTIALIALIGLGLAARRRR